MRYNVSEDNDVSGDVGSGKGSRKHCSCDPLHDRNPVFYGWLKTGAISAISVLLAGNSRGGFLTGDFIQPHVTVCGHPALERNTSHFIEFSVCSGLDEIRISVLSLGKLHFSPSRLSLDRLTGGAGQALPTFEHQICKYEY